MSKRMSRMLLEAIGARNIADAKLSLLTGASADGSSWRRAFAPHQPTPLIAAVHAGSREIVELLLDHGANPDRGTAHWPTPLALACAQGDRGIVELLLERGAALNGAGTRHGSALEHAAWYLQDDLVALLLERGADPQPVMTRGLGSLIRISDSILTQLIAAGGQAPPEIVKMLAAKGSGR